MRSAGIAIALGAALIASGAAADVSRFANSADQAKDLVMVQPRTALRLLDRSEIEARTIRNEESRTAALATVYRLRGEAFTQLDKPAAAAPFLEKALALARKSRRDGKLQGEILLSMGGVRNGMAQTAAAFKNYEQAHRIFQAAGDHRNEVVSLLYISSLYGDANDFASALKYVNQAASVNLPDDQIRMSIYNNRASVLRELGDYAQAEAGYRNAVALAIRLHTPSVEARVLTNIARLRLKIGDIAGANILIRQADALPQLHAADIATVRPQLLAVAAQAALQARDYGRARALIEERFEGVDLAATTIAFREAHQTAYETYRALGDSSAALVHLAALKRLDDQATKLATSANSALAAARFDFANQELRLATLQRDDANRRVAFARQRSATDRAIFVGVVLATIVIIALLGVWLASVRRARLRERAAAADLAATNDALGKALAAKTEFLATTSHEIRTPLNGILGMTQVMLADRSIAADARDRLTVVHGAGLTMRALVDDILDVAKMETGNLTIECAPFDLRETLSAAGRLWAAQAQDKGVGFVLDLDDSPGWIAGDAARVRQIVFNLLSNALKFTQAGRITLRADRDGATYRLRVADSGIGIPADQMGHIFDSFRQADASTTRRFGGTGLGLTICRKLAHAMDGSIAVESEVGRGTAFTVTLPLATTCREEPVEAAPSAAGRVVIVDASPITRVTLRTLVARHRPEPIALGSVADALAIATDAELVLVDQNAAGDLDALAALAAAAPLAVLWRGQTPDAIAALGRVVAKPIDGAALAATLFGPKARPSLEQHAA